MKKPPHPQKGSRKSVVLLLIALTLIGYGVINDLEGYSVLFFIAGASLFSYSIFKLI